MAEVLNSRLYKNKSVYRSHTRRLEIGTFRFRCRRTGHSATLTLNYTSISLFPVNAHVCQTTSPAVGVSMLPRLSPPPCGEYHGRSKTPTVENGPRRLRDGLVVCLGLIKNQIFDLEN